MSKTIFVNLPVADLERSARFYEAVGARKEPKFSNEQGAMMVLSDTIHVMLLTHGFFSTFTPKRIPNARESAQMILCLSEDDREAVDAHLERARAAGGTADPTPIQDYGLMYGRSYEDPDGHIWEVMWMDAGAAEQGASSFEPAQAA